MLTASSEPLCASVLAAVQTLLSLFPQTEEWRDKRTAPTVSQSVIGPVKSLIWMVEVEVEGDGVVIDRLSASCFCMRLRLQFAGKIAQHRLLSGLLLPYLSLICIYLHKSPLAFLSDRYPL